MKKITSLAFVLGLAGAQVACNIEATTPAPSNTDPAPPAMEGDDPMKPAPTPAPGKAIVRVIHGSPNAPSVDVYAKGSERPLVTGLMYGQTSAWLEIDPGAYEVELRAAPSKPTDPIAYKTGVLNIAAGVKISAVAAGLLGSQDLDDAFRVVPVVESFGKAETGTARVRVLHAGSDAPSVDLDVGNDDPASPEVKGLARFADTGADGVGLPANTALAIGIAVGGQRVTAFTTPKLAEGADVIVIATGLLGKLPRMNDGFSLLAVGPSGSLGFIKQDPVVYALHGSPNTPAVDAFVGNTEIVSNISFGQLSAPIQVQPGDYTLDFYAASAGSARPAGSPAASAPTGNLAAGERYLAIATGFLHDLNASQSFRLAGYREGFALDSGKPQLRAIHSSPDAPKVDIGLATGNKIDPVLFSGLSFGEASTDEGLGAFAGNLLVGVTPAAQNTSIVARVTVPAQNSQRAFVIAAGALNPARGQAFRFFTVDTTPTPWTVTTSFTH
ncbi:MAG: DUF4397 domain-containing protein [Labilithrix sp.]|nr:DUF4397 domain-containing protein [Labilithrix sp.]